MKKFLILAFLIVLVWGGRAEAINLVKNGTFSVDDDETGWTRFEDGDMLSEWSVADGSANLIFNASEKCNNMYYQVVKAPVGATVSVAGDWMSTLTGTGDYWAEFMFGTFEDAYALDTMIPDNTMIPGKEDWTKLEQGYSEPGTIPTPAIRDTYPCPTDDYKTRGNDGEGGIAFKKDAWGMNQGSNPAWNWQAASNSPSFPRVESLENWNAGELGRTSQSSVTSMGDVFVILKLGGSDLSGSVSFDNIEINVDIAELQPGDADCDGDVDVSDLGILATNYGATNGAVWGEGDFTNGGEINASDLGILATHYRTGTAAQAVPEPSTLCLLLLGTLTIAWRRRR